MSFFECENQLDYGGQRTRNYVIMSLCTHINFNR